jgi:predicted TIM-barrel fold metal-dependent hydrolase
VSAGTDIFDARVRLVGDPAGLLSTMDACGITRAGVSAGAVVGLSRLARQIRDGSHSEADPNNAAVAAASAASAGRLVAWYFANPRAAGALDTYQRVAGEFVGLELSPAVHGVAIADPRSLALVAHAARVGHAVYTVCLHRRGSTVADLVALARRYPQTPFVLGHCGHIGIDLDAVDTIAPWPNILAETSGCFTVTARHALATLGPARILFGSEYPLQHPRVELAKYAVLDLDDATWRAVAWENADRILTTTIERGI